MNTEEHQEEHLLAAARRGDRAAFGRLVEAHARQVFRVCYRVTGNEAMAEDAVQETFIKAWRKFSAFDGCAAFSTWLHRIAVNAALEQLRRDRRHAADAPPENDHIAGPAWTDAAPTPERVTESSGIAHRAAAVLAELSALERSAFVLRHYQEMPIAEICAVLGMKPSAVKQAIFRAVKKMRAALVEYKDSNGVQHAAGE
ncbi:MAG TPA: RNA polymerase sigma factor [Gammaproteobacteria bacterium]